MVLALEAGKVGKSEEAPPPTAGNGLVEELR